MAEEYHRDHRDHLDHVHVHVHVLNLQVIDQMGDHHVLGMIMGEMTCEKYD